MEIKPTADRPKNALSSNGNQIKKWKAPLKQKHIPRTEIKRPFSNAHKHTPSSDSHPNHTYHPNPNIGAEPTKWHK